MSSPGVAKGAPSFTIQSAVQTASNAQENYTSKTKLILQNDIYEQKIFLEAIRTLGKGMSCKGASMAQSSGNGKLPRTGPRPVTITTQQNPFPRGSLSWLGHLRRGGLSLAVALRTQGAIRSRVMARFSWAMAGVRLAQRDSSNS